MAHPNIISLDTINKIKTIVATSLASDDDLMKIMILKGGNAISMGYGLSDRPSYDLDYSLEEDFEDFSEISDRLKELLVDGFETNNLHLFDYNAKQKPMSQTNNLDFWGGYEISFKIIEQSKFKEIGEDENIARSKYALRLNESGSPVFSIDISKFEYVGENKQLREVDGIGIYMYLPELLIAEKIRALCQRLPEYTTNILVQKEKKLKARARDFFDIYILLEEFPFDFNSESFKETLKSVFDAKKVPLEYVKKIRSMYELHRQDFISIQATTSDKELKNKDFDFFFNYFMDRFENIFD